MGYSQYFYVILPINRNLYKDKVYDLIIPDYLKTIHYIQGHYTLREYFIQLYIKLGGCLSSNSSTVSIVITLNILLKLINDITLNKGLFKDEYLNTINEDGIDMYEESNGENKTYILTILYKLLDEIDHGETVIYVG